MRTLIVMLTFFTRIPIPIRFEVKYQDYIKGIGWVPIISLIIGLPLYLIGYYGTVLNQHILSVVILIVYLFITGSLHIDGMADTMDAFGSNRSKERMLEIMKDSRIGTFGVLAIVVYCISMVAIIPMVPLYVILLFPLAGRTSALVCAKTNHYARTDGMGRSFVEGTSMMHVLLGFITYAIMGVLIIKQTHYLTLFGPLILAVIITAILVKSMSKKIDGITGDIIGFSVEFSQLLYLLMAYSISIIL